MQYRGAEAFAVYYFPNSLKEQNFPHRRRHFPSSLCKSVAAPKEPESGCRSSAAVQKQLIVQNSVLNGSEPNGLKVAESIAWRSSRGVIGRKAVASRAGTGGE
jgi:hypothetical protein